MRRMSTRQRWGDDPAPRVRVLLECEPADSPSIIASIIEQHGFSVRTCEGPRDQRCGLLEDGVCELIDGADVVVNMLRSPPTGPSVLQAVAHLRRAPAIVAEMPASTRTADPPGTSGEEVITLMPPMTSRNLIEGIRESLDRRDLPRSWWGDGFC